jgi:hypothetical protein
LDAALLAQKGIEPPIFWCLTCGVYKYVERNVLAGLVPVDFAGSIAAVD